MSGFKRTQNRFIRETPTVSDLSKRDSDTLGRHWALGNQTNMSEWSVMNEISNLRRDLNRLKRRAGVDDLVGVSQFLHPFQIYQLPEGLRQEVDRGDVNKFWVRSGNVAYRTQYLYAGETPGVKTPHPQWITPGYFTAVGGDGILERLADDTEEKWKQQWPSYVVDYPLSSFTLDPVVAGGPGDHLAPTYLFYVELAEATKGFPTATIKCGKTSEAFIAPQLVIGYAMNHWDPEFLSPEDATQDWFIHQSRVGDIADYYCNSAWAFPNAPGYPTIAPFYEADRIYYPGEVIRYTGAAVEIWVMHRYDVAISGVSPAATNWFDYWTKVARPSAT